MTTPFSQIHFHQMGGAVARVGEDDTAFGNRRAAFAYTLNAMFWLCTVVSLPENGSPTWPVCKPVKML